MNKIKLVFKKWPGLGGANELYRLVSLRGAVRVGFLKEYKIVGDYFNEDQVAALCQDTTTYVVEVTI